MLAVSSRVSCPLVHGPRAWLNFSRKLRRRKEDPHLDHPLLRLLQRLLQVALGLKRLGRMVRSVRHPLHRLLQIPLFPRSRRRPPGTSLLPHRLALSLLSVFRRLVAVVRSLGGLVVDRA